LIIFPKGICFIQEFVNFVNFRLPAPIVPNFSQIPELLPDAIVIAIVIYAVTFSIGKLFGRKNKYRVDPRQVIVVCLDRI
jgi:MFS superfamily sulfate permease-like transporter